MKKIFILFIVIGFVLVGCSQEPKNEISETVAENGSEAQAETEIETNSKTKMNDLELKDAEEIDIFKRAVSNSKKEPGIVNMAEEPQYQFSIGEETYFLWITEESGTIMNTKDTYTIYTLSSSSVKEVYEFVNKG
ncbi:hypothetical protein ACQKKK_21105 [Peribacillus sp. NPDC006672]|uniref:hypothetical protein n=1 Tax=Peribacillus sp. NPDC006672 TaxID=3390606 RepID=UPI003D088E57